MSYPVSFLPCFAFNKTLCNVITHNLSSQTLFMKPLLLQNNGVVTCSKAGLQSGPFPYFLRVHFVME